MFEALARWTAGLVPGQILHLQTDQLTILPLLYRADGVILGPKRLNNVTGPNVWNGTSGLSTDRRLRTSRRGQRAAPRYQPG
jgi:hypothetical protein